MRFNKKMEYRGSSSRVSAKTGNAYTIFNLEDVDTGEAFSCMASGLDYVVPPKGSTISCDFDLNLKYGNIRLVDYEVLS